MTYSSETAFIRLLETLLRRSFFALSCFSKKGLQGSCGCVPGRSPCSANGKHRKFFMFMLTESRHTFRHTQLQSLKLSFTVCFLFCKPFQLLEQLPLLLTCGIRANTLRLCSSLGTMHRAACRTVRKQHKRRTLHVSILSAPLRAFSIVFRSGLARCRQLFVSQIIFSLHRRLFARMLHKYLDLSLKIKNILQAHLRGLCKTRNWVQQ